MDKIPRTHEAIEAQIKEIQSKKSELPENGSNKGVSLGETYYDSDIYDNAGTGGKSRYDGYVTSIAANDEAEDEDLENVPITQKKSGYSASLLNDIVQSDKDYDPFAGKKRPTIADREDEYRRNRRRLIISPPRMDPFAEGGKTPDVGSRTYTEIMKEQYLRAEETELRKKLIEKAREGTLKPVAQANGEAAKPAAAKRKGRWDQSADETPVAKKPVAATPSSQATPSWDQEKGAWEETPGAAGRGGETPGATPSARVWDATPGHITPGHATPGRDTPAQHASRRNRWDETPKTDRETPGHNSGWAETPRTDRGSGVDTIQETPTPGTKRRSRWDETPGATPAAATPTPSHATPSHATPSHATPSHATPTPHTPVFTPGGSTPVGVKAMAMATPTPGHVAAMTPEQLQAYRWEKEIDERNRPYTDEELDAMFPPGYKVLPPPAGYVPIRTPARKLTATPTPLAGTPIGFFMQTEELGGSAAAAARLLDPQPKGSQQLPFMKPEDAQYFDKLLIDVDEDTLSPEELKERKIMKLLLKIKNGTPPMCKAALRQITDKAREFGAGPLFNQILPLLMSPTLEDQERHLLVKVIDRILYKLDDLVRPYVHKILVVIEPLLIDEDYYARVEGREIISNLAKAAGLATMISTMRPDIDNIDEYVRNTTARAFAVVASALGIPSLLPFLKAVCRSKKSWQARHTGIKIVQQIAILMGCAILPHLKSLVEIIEHGLVDEQQKVRTITALASAALAEAATPYGIESFDSVLKPLWKGIRTHRGKGLAAFLKAIGYLIPLMDAEYANYYTREVMLILIREFQSPDEEMKKIVLKVVKQCCGTDGVEPQYIMDEILPHFFKHFWNHRMALDRRNYRQLVDTTVEIANKVGASEIINRIVDDLKDDNEQYRKMVMESIEKILANLGAADIDSKLEEALIDGILYAFQEQTTEDVVMLNGFGTIVNQLGKRVKPYLPQICGIILWRMNNKSAKVRQQAADLISRIAVVMKTCQEEKLMGHLGVVLYEYLGEEYPEVLGSILGALKAIVNVIGMTKMTPPIKDLLPRLTPILKNRHEKVQENCIDLVGRIADRGPEFVSAREWMRICFELLELLKAHKKAIRRATVNTFGYIAKAIGPHDVLATLLNNLKVQERQNRVCTTVAIAIVAETCSPFTVLPALMNEYRVPELNVQNGVLKSLSFLFEYIGEMGKDYIYAVCPLLEDALMDRDLVHRQTACAAIKHMALGVFGFGCEDALIHLLNHVWPNIFETSPHLVQAFMDAVEGMRVALGPLKILQYALQEKLMGHLGVVLYEYLGEEYPEVLGSILGALKAIVNVIGMTKMTPPIKDLLPRLTPILKNRHEKVQENCIDLVGRIADRGPEFVSAREWMRICFELLELLKAHKKAIRRATVNTFGYIAKAIGPHDVLATLLNNLKVQERQNRVCTTVAIAIVAETCSPFTVLPALMNEYRVPELNVQNGVLKSLSFLFEYIGEMGKDYIYAVCPLLEDALMDRDLVHRQTACAAIKHMALGVFGFGCEDALIHLLNHVWPNIFETSPHLVQAFMDAVEGMRVALGPLKILQYALQEKLMGHLGVVLYEYLGEEYPEVLGSILGALKAIVNVIGMTKMTPPIKDLLPRLTPILKNRHEKVQENCIDLVGRIADRGPEFVSAREWMRICFELLELLKAHKKAIRRATVNTFGYIAKAIGPHDVLATLLNNLKVQERQNRVCTTVAIAIVAETCSPFTVLPALMNEYRVPELNVQNGVLKSLSFLFEYIGEMGKDYIYAVCPLLEDALMDRDLVHRQTACAAIKHMALGVFGFGCEDALIHLLNHVWPNIFETSPHLVQAFMDAVEGMRVALGPLKILQYALQGLFHPARKVRDVYWKIYNTLYIGGQDALVAGYPRIQNDPNNHYIRYELDYML